MSRFIIEREIDGASEWNRLVRQAGAPVTGQTVTAASPTISEPGNVPV